MHVGLLVTRRFLTCGLCVVHIISTPYNARHFGKLTATVEANCTDETQAAADNNAANGSSEVRAAYTHRQCCKTKADSPAISDNDYHHRLWIALVINNSTLCGAFVYNQRITRQRDRRNDDKCTADKARPHDMANKKTALCTPKLPL